MSCNPKSKTALRLSDLVEEITIEAPADVHETSGAITRTYATAYTRWGSLTPTGGAEGDQFREIEGHATYRVEIRHDSALALALKDTHRLLLSDGRYLDILRIAVSIADDKITITANDYLPTVTAGALNYSGTDYDAILRNESVERPYVDAGEQTTRDMVALVRVSDFAAGITAENSTCTINTRTYRIRSVGIPARGNWYKLMLSDEFGELPQ